MNLFDILACPTCKVAIDRHDQTLTCRRCQRSYPIVNSVPVLFPDGSVPMVQHEADLVVRRGYDPWIQRVVMQSLPANAVVLDLGSGNMAFSLPNVIRMDVTLTPYVDVVGDAHAMPFLPGALDFIFALAVIEHLRQPFLAAQEMYDALRMGGYVYGECNFVFPYHGYPHHYFNASQQGLLEVFALFHCLRASVAPYQMPSFAVRFILESYNSYLGASNDPALRPFLELLNNVLAQPLQQYDAYFSEELALRLAAGVFFFGVKSPNGASEVIPAPVLSRWQQSRVLQQRFPDPLNLGMAENLLRWAKTEGQAEDADLAAYFAQIEPFRKGPEELDETQTAFDELPVIEPRFGHIPDEGTAAPLTATMQQLQQRIVELETQIQIKNQHIGRLESLQQQIDSSKFMRVLNWVQKWRAAK
ncbi:MAG: class I SAM-dependent methyltransferase [Chloroflexales bacterium]|nr:class I SAM-dependent methyltransferase [Chloroflexales bacterium]